MIRVAVFILLSSIVVESVYVITRYDPVFLRAGLDFDRTPESRNPELDILTAEKRTAQSVKSLPAHEHVCKTLIKTDYQPEFGHEQNGTRVEIQQDHRRQFRATFIECENTERTECHGIDNSIFTSECVTLYEFRSAGVRIVGSPGDFVEGLIKVPITCQCRLRRKFNRP
ncbi:hypothetical protein FO519_005592 [Halicephalobus sp. NKZ332]|nr:hypothetical protein FO519_005592 [Halicephalobus sp. NKZ332]